MNVELGIKGFYTLRIGDAKTGKIRQTLEFENVITDIGLDRIGTNAPIAYAFVGTGTATPAVTDQKLSVFLAATNTAAPAGNNVATQATTAPWWGGYVKAYRFGEGVAAGNLTEIGVGWGGTSQATHLLFSRALIKDGAGNPTTITVLPNEFLDVSYESRVYLPADDVVFTNVMIYGNPHKFTVRGIAQAAAGDQGGLGVSGWNAYGNFNAYRDFALSAITASAVSGTSLANGAASAAAYTSGSLKRAQTVTYGLTSANHANGISGFYMVSGSGSYLLPKFQILVEPPIMKDNTKTLALTVTWRWARR